MQIFDLLCSAGFKHRFTIFIKVKLADVGLGGRQRYRLGAAHRVHASVFAHPIFLREEVAVLGVIIGGLLSGLALGMLGAGGTIIGLPMILYLGGPTGHAAFGTNAFAVAIIAALLLAWRVQRGEVDGRVGIVFALPGLVGIAIGARLGLIYPATKLVFLLSFLILIVATWIGYLSRNSDPEPNGEPAKEFANWLSVSLLLRVVPTAFAVGLISGFFAIGGGFLVVPGMAIAAAIDLRSSARSSLVPIAAFAGLDALEYVAAGNVRLESSGVMILVGLVGGALGLVLSNRLRLQVLQRIFAIFLACVAIYMIAQHV